MLKNRKKIIATAKFAVIVMAIYKIVDFRFQKNLFSNERPYNQIIVQKSEIVESHDRKTLNEIVNF